MSWDGFQREVLAELGLRPYALAVKDARATQVHAAVDVATVEPGALPPALVAALARAAGCAPAQVLALAGIDAAPRDAAARRALWPRLRRLRERAR